MGLSFTEQETIIRWDREEKLLHVYTADATLLPKLNAHTEIYTKVNESRQNGKVIAADFTAPLRALTLRMKFPAKKALTDEQKEVVRQRLAGSLKRKG